MIAVSGNGALPQTPSSAVAIVGEFSNMRYTEEHAYGYSVQLWRERGRLFGLFLASAGLAGDTPTGVLENVKFDSRTGKLSFSARLTIGSVLLANGQQAPSRDFFEFEGAMTGSMLTGTLRESDRLQASRPASSKRIRLTKQSETTMSRAKSYDEWRSEVSEILRHRGPKW